MGSLSVWAPSWYGPLVGMGLLLIGLSTWIDNLWTSEVESKAFRSTLNQIMNFRNQLEITCPLFISWLIFWGYSLSSP